MKITINQDQDVVNAARAKLKEYHNQCPCVLPPFHNDDTKCMCKKFRDLIKNGYTGFCPCEYFYVTQ